MASHDDALRLRAALDAGQKNAAHEIRQALKQYRFYHCIELAPGITTPGFPGTASYVDRFQDVAAGLDFHGTRVLDVGCRDGAMALIAERAGAARVVGVDNDVSPGLVNFVLPFLGSRIEALLWVLAHELRHLWQAASTGKRRGMVYGAKGRFSERDADAYALQMLRRYRRGELASLGGDNPLERNEG